MVFSKIETSDEKLGGLLVAQTLLVLASSPAIPKLSPSPRASTAGSRLAAVSLLIHPGSRVELMAMRQLIPRDRVTAAPKLTADSSKILPWRERIKKQELSGHG